MLTYLLISSNCAPHKRLGIHFQEFQVSRLTCLKDCSDIELHHHYHGVESEHVFLVGHQDAIPSIQVRI